MRVQIGNKRKIKEDIKKKSENISTKIIEKEVDKDNLKNNNLLKTIENDNEDSTDDDEGVENSLDENEVSDISFESDDEGYFNPKVNGNLKKILNKKSKNDDDEDSENTDTDNENEESDDDNEGSDNDNEDDDDDNEDSDNDNEDSDDENEDTDDENEDIDNDKTENEESSDNEAEKPEDDKNIEDTNEHDNKNNKKSENLKESKNKINLAAKNIENDKSTIKNDKDETNIQNKKIKTKKLSENINISLNSKAENDDEDIITSDEEDIRNTVGNIPLQWYNEYRHIGYDWDARKIIKPPQGDQIDEFLKKIEDPNFWRTVKDPQTGQDVIIGEEDVELIRRITSGKVPNKDHNEYENWIEWFTSEVEQMPIKNIPEHKRSFLPSMSEKKKVSRMVHALKMGWMKTREELEKEKKAKKEPKFYMLWETDTGREDMRRIHDHVTAPKRDLPGHAESYNPPPEYLFDAKEMKEWERLKDEPHKRKLHFLPQKFKSLREVPAYSRFIRERFLRCLDLYLCPRAKRTKLNIDAEYLIPKLPSPKDLQPFPTVESMVYRGHADFIRTISVEPKGQYLISGSDDMTVKIWEVSTGRCIRTIETGDVVRCVAWCPNPKLSLVAVASGQRLLLINPLVGDKVIMTKTDDLLAQEPSQSGIDNERIHAAVQWETCTDKPDSEKGVRIIIKHFKSIKQVTWHGKGDYFATVMPDGANRSALIHQLSKRGTQIPFSKSKGLIQYVLFHPIKPCLFVATQHNVRIYDLVKQELVKKLVSNSKWISGMAIHPKGDNLLVATYDKKMLWFDLDLSTKPYQTIRLHKNAVRNVSFHLRYPLFASASDDLTVIVSHGMVYNDLLQNPLIVPLKKLLGHEAREELGVLDVVWHPTQPWVFSAGADTTIKLYT